MTSDDNTEKRMVHVFIILDNIVSFMAPFPSKEGATNFARYMCKKSGIIFNGTLSKRKVDGLPCTIQIME